MASYIFTDNYLDTDTGITTTTSSENSSFVIGNTVDNNLRKKVYRTAGNWVIDSTNKTIKFNEGAGTLTATIAEATYTQASILTAIDTAITAAGADAYTITWSSNKLVITNDTDTFELECTNASMEGFCQAFGFDTSADTGTAAAHTADHIRIHTEEWVKWDAGTPMDPKAFALIWARNGASKISEGATIKLQGNPADNWTSPAYDQTLSFTDNGIVQLSTTGLHTAGLRYWRLYIQDIDNPNGYIEIGNLYLGDMFVPTSGKIQFPLSVSYSDISKKLQSDGGQVFVRTIDKTEIFNIRWAFLTVTERESLEDFWDDAGYSKPFYIYLDPDAAFSSSADEFFRYVRFMSSPSYSLSSPGYFEMNMSLREEL